MNDIESWLKKNDLGGHAAVFAESEIKLGDLPELTETDIEGLGLPLGPRRRLQKAIRELIEHSSDGPSAQLPTPRPSAEAERRQLTVMFCDLVGSVALGERMDVEDYRNLLARFRNTAVKCVEKYDGFVARHQGDGVLVYFGYPMAHENDAERAVRTGLEILREIPAIECTGGLELATRVGVATGLTVVGDALSTGSAEELAAFGPTPNLAARLQSLAEPNSLLVGESTHALVQGRFETKRLPDATIKGLTSPVAVYKFEAQLRQPPINHPPLTELVGRQLEADLLNDRWRQAEAGEGQIVMLSGEPGVGKTRLVQELQRRLRDDAANRVLYYCSPFNVNVAFHPVRDQLERGLRLSSDDLAEQKRAKLYDALARLELDPNQHGPPLWQLLSLGGADQEQLAGLSAESVRGRIFEALLAMVEAMSRQKPVFILIEDLHWVDPTTQEYLGLLFERLNAWSVLTILTSRPEYESRWSRHPRATFLTLNYLGRKDSEALVQQVAGADQLPRNVVADIVSRADGVPLFVEELTKAVVESRGSGTLEQLDVPATLQDSLMARLDRLITAKGVAQLGATIGRRFSYELLHAASQLDELTLQLELGRLVESELLYQRGHPPQATYTFKHALIQDIAYRSLLKGSRQQYHRRIAEVLTQQFLELKENQPELIAHHYTEAELIEQAIPYWQKAGQQFLQRSAYLEGIAHLERGLGLLETLSESPERPMQELRLLAALGPALMAVRGYNAPEVEQTYTRARVLCRQIGDAPELLPILGGLWRFYFALADLHNARDVGEQLLVLAEREADPIHLIASHWLVGTPAVWLGDVVNAHEHFDAALAIYRPQNIQSFGVLYGFDLGVMSYAYTAVTLWALGSPGQALKRSQEALRLAQELSHPLTLGYVYLALSVFHYLRQEGRAAQEYAEALIVLSTEHGFELWLAWGPFLRGLSLALQGRTEEAVTLMHQGRSAMREAGIELLQPCFLTQMADISRAKGQFDEGLQLLADAMSFMDTTEERFFEPEVHRLKGQLILQQSSPNADAAEACFRKAIIVAQNQSAKSWELRAAISLARLWQSLGRRLDAHHLLAPVYDWFTEGFDTVDLQDAKGLLDELRTEIGDAQA